MTTCIEEGCTNSTYAKQRCRKHYCAYFVNLRKTKCIQCGKTITHRAKKSLCSRCCMQTEETRKKISIKSANRFFSEEKKKEIAAKKSKSIKDTYKSKIDKYIEKYKKIIDSINVTNLLIDWSTFTGRNNKIKTIDPIYGEWWTTVSSLIKGITHPKRHNDKVKKTCLERYGVENAAKHPDNIRKRKDTFNKKTEEEIHNISAKRSETCKEKYGVDHTFKAKEVKEKIKKTCKERYGVDHYFQSEQVKDNIRKTCIERYGVEWTGAIPIAADKRKQTFLERYGVENSSQVLDIALKAAKSSNNRNIKYHWLTGEELICQGSYEAKVVDYLNANKVNYKWQPEVFTLSNGKTYRPDLYLIDSDTWVEIKGWMREDAKIKWCEFITMVKRSELWDKEKLTKMKIL